MLACANWAPLTSAKPNCSRRSMICRNGSRGSNVSPRSNSGVLQIATRATEREPTPIVDSPGRLVGYVHCRTCHRCVHVDLEAFPTAPVPESYRARLRCTKCGGRAADIQIGWATPSAQPQASAKPAGGQIVYLSERAKSAPG